MPRPAAPKAHEFTQKRGQEVEELRQELVRAFARRDAVDRRIQSAIAAIDVDAGGSIDDAVEDALANLDIYHESDWSVQPTEPFADGVEVVDGIPYTVVQTALAGPSWGIVNGSGFVWVPPTSAARSWALASLATAPYFYVPLSSIPGVDLQRPLIIDVHLTGQVYENGNDAVRVGLWEPGGTPYVSSIARARMFDRGNFAATSTIRSFDGTAAATATESYAPDSVSIRIEPFGLAQIFFGTWADGWPAQWNPLIHNPTLPTGPNMFSLSARLTFVFINASDPSVTTTATIANVRYRRG